MLLISTMKATLLVLLIVTYIGPSAGPPQDDEDYVAPDSEFPWSPGESEEAENILSEPSEDHDLSKNNDYYNLPEVESKLSSKQLLHTDNPSEDAGEDLFDLLKNPAIDLDLKRMINLPWSRGRKKKPNGQSKIKDQYCRISTAPTRRPACQGSTSTSSLPRSSSSCLYTPKPTASPDMCTPRLPPPTPKPPPCRGKASKSRQKTRFRTLNSKTGAMLLKIILDTKQHVLFALEILNHMENEVLVRSPDTCQRLNCNQRTAVPKTQCSAPKQKPQKVPKFPSCSGYHRKNPSSMKMAKEKMLKQKVQLASNDPEDNWNPTSSNRVKNLPLDTKPMRTNRYGYKKYQKQQPKMKTIPPGMIAIIV